MTNRASARTTRDIGARIMLAEWLFVEIVADLRGRSHDPPARSRYELLGIAPLLRKLLTDSEPLLVSVKRARMEIVPQFRIRPWQVPSRLDDSLDYLIRLSGSELVGGAETHAISVEQFLTAKVGLLEGKELTVKQIVRYYSHVEGGVHFGSPKEQGEEAMRSMAPVLLGNTTGQIEILGYLGLIVAEALTPLYDSILTSPSIIRGMHHLNDAGFYENHWSAAHYAKS